MDVWAGWADDYKVGQVMIYIKSIVIGVVALFSATIVYLVILIAVIVRRYPPPPAPPGGHISLDLRSIINHGPPVWPIALLAFALGFYWEFRRASR